MHLPLRHTDCHRCAGTPVIPNHSSAPGIYFGREGHIAHVSEEDAMKDISAENPSPATSERLYVGKALVD